MPDTHWAVQMHQLAATHDWVTGYGPRTFKPGALHHHAEVSGGHPAACWNAARIRPISAAISASFRTFADVTESHWAYWYAMEAANGHDYTKSGGSETGAALIDNSFDAFGRFVFCVSRTAKSPLGNL